MSHLCVDAITVAHMVDDYERQRTSALRQVENDRRLLQDAQHALANGRYEVVAEFMERVVAGLAKAGTTLREDHR